MDKTAFTHLKLNLKKLTDGFFLCSHDSKRGCYDMVLSNRSVLVSSHRTQP